MNNKKLSVDDFKVYSAIKTTKGRINCWTYCKINGKYVKYYYNFDILEYCTNNIDFLGAQTHYTKLFKDLGVRDIIERYENIEPLTKDDIEYVSETIMTKKPNIYLKLNNLSDYIEKIKDSIADIPFLIDFNEFRRIQISEHCKEMRIKGQKINKKIFNTYIKLKKLTRGKDFYAFIKNEKILRRYFHFLFNRHSNKDYEYYMSYSIFRGLIDNNINENIYIDDFYYTRKP